MTPLTDKDKIRFMDRFVVFEEAHIPIDNDDVIKAKFKGTDITGYGDTHEEAFRNLIKSLQEYITVLNKVHLLCFAKLGLP